MKEMPASCRPVERALERGAASLSDEELLAVLLGSGPAGETVVELAQRLLALGGAEGPAGLCRITREELLAVRGIGSVKAAKVLCCVELSKRIAGSSVSSSVLLDCPEKVTARYMESMRHLEVEHVLMLLLDSRGMLISEETIAVGTVNGALASPREIFRAALRKRAVSVILLHNHPSGDPTPSREDLEFTRRVQACGAMLGIPLSDHIIIGDRLAVSFCREGILGKSGDID